MEETLSIISSELKECGGHKPFLQTLYEAVNFESSEGIKRKKNFYL